MINAARLRTQKVKPQPRTRRIGNRLALGQPAGAARDAAYLMNSISW
ncbi:MAG: hypothetical protein KatS3mg108_1952 [Isosphaeraceae bacterium]|jgi:hypothetical protein|nr:MAG: hypothetical protein KatS3mg108_1952 [Isosphaeraceae bacterium]